MKTAVNRANWGSWAKYQGKSADIDQMLADAKEAGYDGVEVGGGADALGDAKAFRKKVEGLGLEIAAYGGNVTYNPFPPNTKQYQASFRHAAEMEVPIIMCCGGFIPNQRRNTYDFDYDMFADNLGRAIRFAEKLGLTLAFHPHRGCVVETIEETQQMIKRLPELKLTADIAHLEASGANAMEFCRQFGDRIVYTHIKDYHWKKDSFVELGKGDGNLDVADCVRILDEAGYEGWLTVELDKRHDRFTNPPTPLESSQLSRRYLKRHCKI